jgi:hypothetical protein
MPRYQILRSAVSVTVSKSINSGSNDRENTKRDRTSIYPASIYRASIYRASIYHVPPFTAQFCLPPRGTVHRGSTVIR